MRGGQLLYRAAAAKVVSRALTLPLLPTDLDIRGDHEQNVKLPAHVIQVPEPWRCSSHTQDESQLSSQSPSSLSF